MLSAAPGRSHQKLLAVGALLLGALAIGSSALFVKVSETAPVATAFWRVFLALPFLWAWSVIGQGHRHRASFAGERGLLIAAGLFFAGDLAFWHWSIVLTSVANSTLLANLAPIFVTLAAWLLFRKQLSMKFMTGLAIALIVLSAMVLGRMKAKGELPSDFVLKTSVTLPAANPATLTLTLRPSASARVRRGRSAGG